MKDGYWSPVNRRLAEIVSRSASDAFRAASYASEEGIVNDTSLVTHSGLVGRVRSSFVDRLAWEDIVTVLFP